MITSLAWKNVWRNKTRSLTVIAAVTVGVFAGVFSMAAINSSIVQRIDAAVNEELSHIQVNNKEFRSSGDLLDFIGDPGAVKSRLEQTPERQRPESRHGLRVSGPVSVPPGERTT